jgi:hypothetical protein
LAALAVLVSGTAVALGDPLPGEVLKFQQLPINNLVIPGAIYQGHDELSTAYEFLDATGNVAGWRGNFMADDFADKFSEPVVHIKWWGSYLNNFIPTPVGIQKFLISFETDVPQTPVAGSFSHPGSPLLNQIVSAGALAPASGTFTETLINGNAPEHLFQYNAELAIPFAQQPNTVYWLKIVALTGNTNVQWGWHDRDYTFFDPFASQPPFVNPGENNLGTPGFPIWHFQDDAIAGSLLIGPPTAAGGPVFVQQDPTSYLPQKYLDGIDGPPGIGAYSKDLAFELYRTVPEPAGTALLLLGATSVVRRRRQ